MLYFWFVGFLFTLGLLSDETDGAYEYFIMLVFWPFAIGVVMAEVIKKYLDREKIT